MANPWFRMYSEFVNDPKVQRLSEIDQRRYIMLLCLRCSNEDVTLHDEDVTFSLRINADDWADTKAFLIERGLINSRNQPCAWEKRQYTSDTSTARVAKHRALQKQQSNADVTLQKQQSNALEQNRTEQIQKEPLAPAEEKHSAIAFDFTKGEFSNINGQMQVWERAYPAISIQSEINKAAAWLIANPKNRKSNYAKFLTGWFSRTQDKAPAQGGNSSAMPELGFYK